MKPEIQKIDQNGIEFNEAYLPVQEKFLTFSNSGMSINDILTLIVLFSYLW